jgi:hypothetical protein
MQKSGGERIPTRDSHLRITRYKSTAYLNSRQTYPQSYHHEFLARGYLFSCRYKAAVLTFL